MAIVPGLEMLLTVLILCADCSPGGPPAETLLVSLPADTAEGLADPERVAFDADTSRDGNGALRVEVDEAGTFVLYELQDIEAGDVGGYLAFRASLRAEDLDGVAYLEIACPVLDSDDLLRGGSPRRIAGTTRWMRQEAPLFLPEKVRGGRIELNLVVHGPGTVWVDALELVRVGHR